MIGELWDPLNCTRINLEKERKRESQTQRESELGVGLTEACLDLFLFWYTRRRFPAKFELPTS